MGIGRSRRARRVAGLGVPRPPAHRPRRPPGRRAEHGQDLPEVPRRPARSRRSSCSACATASSRRCATRATRSTCSRSRSSPRSRSTSGTSTSCSRSCAACANFAELSDDAFRETLDMLAGRYPSDQFAGLRPRVVWDRVAEPRACPRRRAARRDHERRHDPRPRAVRRVPPRRRAGRRARRGDGLREPRRRVLRARRVDVADRGDHVRPRRRHARAGRAGQDAVLEGRPAGPPARARPRARRADPRAARAARRRRRGAPARATASTPRAATNLRAYLDEQAEATGAVPDDRTIVSSGSPTRSATGACASSRRSARACTRRGRSRSRRRLARLDLPVQVLWSDDGIICRLPESLEDIPLDVLLVDPDELDELVVTRVPTTSLFASRFRENAARALLLPRRRPGERTPLWQQRQRAAGLLEVASGYPTFPILLETTRECLRDVFDLPALREVLTDIRSRRVRVVPVETRNASPFAQSLLFGWIAVVHVRGRRAARRAPRRRTRARSRPAPRPARHRGAARAPRSRGDRASWSSSSSGSFPSARPVTPTTSTTCSPTSARSTDERDRGAQHGRPDRVDRRAARRTPRDPRRRPRLAAVEDAARLRDALGVALPPGLPAAFTDPGRRSRSTISSPATRARTCRSSLDDVAARLGVTAERAARGVARVSRPRAGSCTASSDPAASSASGATPTCCARCGGARSPRCATRSSRSTPRRSFASCPRGRASVGAGAAPTRLIEAIEQLQGRRDPGLGARARRAPDPRRGLPPGDARRAVRGGRAGVDRRGRARRRRRPRPPLLPRPGQAARVVGRRARAADGSAARRDPRRTSRRAGASFWPDLVAAAGTADEAVLLTALWDLVWAGEVTNDTFGPLRVPRRARRRASTRRQAAPGPVGAARSARGRRPLVARRAPARSGAVAHRGRARDRAAAARTARRRHARGGAGRGHARWVRRRVPGVASARGGGPGPPRLVRRRARRRPVRAAGRGRPAARRIARRSPTSPARVVVLAATDPAQPYGAASALARALGRRPPDAHRGRARRADRRRVCRRTSSAAAARC